MEAANADGEAGLSEQRLIEQYIKQFSLEDCLDEILNQVVGERPKNPYTALAHLFTMKTMPEIMDIRMKSIIHHGGYAVRVVICTNAGDFSAAASYLQPPSESREFGILEGKLRDALLSADPRNIKAVDEIVSGLVDVDPAESLALSFACCRAAAKLKNMKLHELIAELSDKKRDELFIPLPVAKVAVRSFNGLPSTVQSLLCFPTKATTVDIALERISSFFSVMNTMEKITKPIKYTAHGTAFVESNSIEDVARVGLQVHRSKDLQDVMLGVNFKGDELLRGQEPNLPSQYLTELGAMKSGQDTIEQIVAMWQESEMIAVDMPVSTTDITALRYFRKVSFPPNDVRLPVH